MSTLNGRVLTLAGTEDVDIGTLIIGSIFASTTNSIYQVLGGSTSELWSPNAAGDVLIFGGGFPVDGLATTGASDSYQVYLK